jgi:porin
MFVNSVIGQPATYGVSANGPTYPLSAPGVRLQWKPASQWSVRLGAYSGAVGSENGTNRHGTRFRFDSESGGFYFGELQREYGEALLGRVKLGGFYTNGLLDDRSSEAGNRERGLGALYATVEQTVYRPPAPAGKDAKERPSKPGEEDEKTPGVSVFARLSHAMPEDRALVAWGAELGVVAQGMLFGRERDSIGLAFCQTHLGKDVNYIDNDRVSAHHESILEATYQLGLHKQFALQPAAQIIFNPGAAARVSTAVVIGLRATLSF